MDSEHEFNAYITKTIKKMGTDYKIIKTSDRFKLGLADWLLIHKGRAIAIESKFIKKVGLRGGLLSHPLSPVQYSFLKSIELAGGLSYVLLGIRDSNEMLCFDYRALKGGNMKVKEFHENPGLYWKFHIHYEDVEGMIRQMFEGSMIYPSCHVPTKEIEANLWMN